MPPPPDLRTLDADLPACPQALMELAGLLRDDAAPVGAIAARIESDMALAAAVVRTVNSAMFGLLRRVETVGEAVRHLGTDEVAAITWATALRAAFPPTPRMRRLWDDAALAGLLMGRAARALEIDPMQAHTAGLFARCGQAVLLARHGERYGVWLDTLADDPPALCAAEAAAWGLTHAALGSAMCAKWGLAVAVVRHVRDRVKPPAAWQGHDRPLRRLLALGAATDALLREARADPATPPPAGPAPDPDAAPMLAVLRPTWARLRDAQARALQDPVPTPEEPSR